MVAVKSCASPYRIIRRKSESKLNVDVPTAKNSKMTAKGARKILPPNLRSR